MGFWSNIAKQLELISELKKGNNIDEFSNFARLLVFLQKNLTACEQHSLGDDVVKAIGLLIDVTVDKSFSDIHSNLADMIATISENLKGDVVLDNVNISDTSGDGDAIAQCSAGPDCLPNIKKNSAFSDLFEFVKLKLEECEDKQVSDEMLDQALDVLSGVTKSNNFDAEFFNGVNIRDLLDQLTAELDSKSTSVKLI